MGALRACDRLVSSDTDAEYAQGAGIADHDRVDDALLLLCDRTNWDYGA